MSMAFLERVLGQPGEKDAVIWKDRCFSYSLVARSNWVLGKRNPAEEASARRGYSNPKRLFAERCCAVPRLAAV